MKRSSDNNQEKTSKKGMFGADVLTNVLVLGGVGMLSVLLAGGMILSSARTHASDTVDSTAQITVSSSCQMTSAINTAHEAEVVASTYQANIGKTTITATCNDANGYAVYAIGYTNSQFGRNDMVGASTGRTINTGTATSGSTSNWAMKLTPVTGNLAPSIVTGWDSYHAVPNEYTKVASYTGSTASNVDTSQFETTYAAFVSSNQTPDTYNGKVRYTLVHPHDTTEIPCASSYTIAYNANGGTGTMSNQTVCVDATTTILPSSFVGPTSGMDTQFALWNTAADGSGASYATGQSVVNLANAGGTITLYAQWAPRYIQDLTRSTCQGVASASPITVIDKRDLSDYTVRYLQGACWMTQNLRITGEVYATNSNFSSSPSINVCLEDLTAGNSNTIPRCHDSGNTTNGVWYNYAAASAGTIIGSSNDTAATEDICPAGWSLPGYNSNNSAGTINSLIQLTVDGRQNFSPVTGGYYSGGASPDNLGNGYWWASKAYNTARRYYLNWNSGNGLSFYYDTRGLGLYIRCVR